MKVWANKQLQSDKRYCNRYLTDWKGICCNAIVLPCDDTDDSDDKVQLVICSFWGHRLQGFPEQVISKQDLDSYKRGFVIKNGGEWTIIS